MTVLLEYLKRMLYYSIYLLLLGRPLRKKLQEFAVLNVTGSAKRGLIAFLNFQLQ